MKKFNYIIDGITKSGTFYEDWNEVPFNAFLQWQQASRELAELEDELLEMQSQLDDLAKRYEKAIFSGSTEKQKEQLVKQAEMLKERIEDFKNKDYFAAQAKSVACFTSVPVSDLMRMDNTTPKGYTDDFSDYELKTNHFLFYKILLQLLANKPLPTSALYSFQWQTKTDAEIAEIEAKINAMPLFYRWKWSKEYRSLQKQLKDAKKGEYKAKDIWNNSTYANKQFQMMARAYIKQLEDKDDWTVLPYLIAMLFTESTCDSQILDNIRDEKDGKAYLERYAQSYKELFERNKALLFEQKKQLTVAHVLGLRGFFAQTAELAESYKKVFDNSDVRTETAIWLCEFLIKHKAEIALDKIVAKIPEGYVSGDFPRQILGLMVSKGFAQSNNAKFNPTFKWIATDNQTAIAEIKKAITVESESKVTQELQDYYEEYGFDRLVAAVSKWVNHENTIEREYDIDRLWIGRYIDFLDKATEYIAWFKSDQSIAKKRLSDLKKIYNKPKSD